MIQRFLALTVLLTVGLGAAPGARAQPCLLFVHGKQTDSGTFTQWSAARDYWVRGSSDFVRTATRGFQTPHYVVGYNGTQPYWSPQAAGEVAHEIVRATQGLPDGGGNRCARTFAQGGTFWIVAHSMGGPVMDFILGNNDPSDPNFNHSGPFDQATARLARVVTLSGAHRGSQGADAVCGDGGWWCSFLAGFLQSCDGATHWLRSADSVQVRTYASPPARTVYLTGGYEGIFGASGCLSGEDDGVVQYASIYACGGSATASYGNANVCGNGNKQEPFGFVNLDAGHENHGDIRNASDRDTRRAIAGGLWRCGASPCPPNTVVHHAMTAAELVSQLY